MTPTPVAPATRRGRRWGKRVAVGAAITLVAVTAGSLAYNRLTDSRVQPADALYPGPFVQIDGRGIAYQQFGSSGSPIVLVGGFAEASWVWNEVGAILGTKHRVYALDLPPFGYSQRKGPFTLSAWAQTVRSFAAHFHLVHPLVVGHSLGAAVAVTAAFDHPEEISGIVLLDGDALSGGGGAWLARFALDPFATTFYRLGTSSDWLFRRALAMASGPDAPSPTTADLRNWQRPFQVVGTKESLFQLSRLGIQGYTLDQLRSVKVPATVIWGANDTIDPLAAGQGAADALGVALITIPDAGHLPMISHPEAVAEAIESAARR